MSHHNHKIRRLKIGKGPTLMKNLKSQAKEQEGGKKRDQPEEIPTKNRGDKKKSRGGVMRKYDGIGTFGKTTDQRR